MAHCSFTRSSTYDGSEDSTMAILTSLATENEDGMMNSLCASFGESKVVGASYDDSRRKKSCLGSKISHNYGHAIPVDQVGDKSVPIAIELPPSRKTRVYTPLTARGDLPGGYFPVHEPNDQSNVYHQPQGLHDRKRVKNLFTSSSSPLHSPIKSFPLSSPNLTSTLSTTSHYHSHHHHPSQHHMASYTLNSSLDPLVPSGKYYPSNYKSTVNYTTIPTTHKSCAESQNISTYKSLNIGLRTFRGTSERVKGHESRGSEATKKLQQYQRDMIAQARKAVTEHKIPSSSSIPAGIILQPIEAGSDAIITPIDLGDEMLASNEGYLTEGERRRKFNGSVEMTNMKI